MGFRNDQTAAALVKFINDASKIQKKPGLQLVKSAIQSEFKQGKPIYALDQVKQRPTYVLAADGLYYLAGVDDPVVLEKEPAAIAELCLMLTGEEKLCDQPRKGISDNQQAFITGFNGHEPPFAQAWKFIGKLEQFYLKIAVPKEEHRKKEYEDDEVFAELRKALDLPPLSQPWHKDITANKRAIFDAIERSGIPDCTDMLPFLGALTDFVEYMQGFERQPEVQAQVEQSSEASESTNTRPADAIQTVAQEDDVYDIPTIKYIQFGIASADDILFCPDEVSAARELNAKIRRAEPQKAGDARKNKPYVCIVNKDFSVDLYVPKDETPGYKIARCKLQFNKDQTEYFFQCDAGSSKVYKSGNLVEIADALMRDASSFTSLNCSVHDTREKVKRSVPAVQPARLSREEKAVPAVPAQDSKRGQLSLDEKSSANPEFNQMLAVIRELQTYLRGQTARLRPHINDLFNKGIADKCRLFELLIARLADISAEILDPNTSIDELNGKLKTMRHALTQCITDCGIIAHHHRREYLDKFANFFIPCIPKVKPIVPHSWTEWREMGGKIGPVSSEVYFYAFIDSSNEQNHSVERYNEYRRRTFAGINQPANAPARPSGLSV